MDSKVEHTQYRAADALEEQKGGPQVVTSKKIGSIRGFCILAAALSLTIFIGLVVVIVLTDINDQSRQNGYYGHLSEAVHHEDCRFHLLSWDWLKPGCQDQESVKKFRGFGPEDWFTDADLDEALHEPCHLRDVAAEVNGRP